MTKDELEGYLAEGLSLEQIAKRIRRDPSTVSYHLKKHGLVPNGHAVHTPNQKVDPDELKKVDGRRCDCSGGCREIRVWLFDDPLLAQEVGHRDRTNGAPPRISGGHQ